MRGVKALVFCLFPVLAAAQPIQVLHEFPEAPVFPAGGVIQVPDGSLYGMADGGIYKIDTGGAVTIVARSHRYASGPLALGSDGALYGTTPYDGDEGRGTIFRFDPVTTELRTLYALRSPTDGRAPLGGLVEVGGQLYGVTGGGPGPAGFGTLFRTDRVTGATETVYGFTAAASSPTGPLTRAADGKLYGMALQAGSAGSAIYRFDPASPGAGIVVVASLASGPVGRLVPASDGRLYGTTRLGGAEGAGTIFSFDPGTGAVTELYALTPSNGSDGIGLGQITIGLDGHLYGTTIQGNPSAGPSPGFGGPPTLFRLRRLAGGVVAYDTLRGVDPQTEGRVEPGVLTAAANGLIYGTAAFDGPLGNGTLFRFDPLAAGPPSNPLQFEVLHAFPRSPSLPTAPVLAPDGFLYGTTRFGGATGRGTVYRLDRSTGAVTILGTLPGDPIGTTTQATSALVLGPDGMLYGTTSSSIDRTPSPTARQNRIVRVDPATGQASAVKEILGPLHPYVAYSGLVRTSAGAIYGLRDEGVRQLFRLDPQANTTTDVASLVGASSSVSSLLAADGGQLYVAAVSSFFFGPGTVTYAASLQRANLVTGTFEVVASLGNDFFVSNPVQGPGGLIYVGVATTTPRVIGVHPTTGAQQVVCDVPGTGYVQTLTAAPDGLLHGTLLWNGPVRHFRCDPATRAVDVEMLPPAVGSVSQPMVAIEGLLYGVSDRSLFRLAASVPLPPLDSDGDGLPNTWETTWGLDPFGAGMDDGGAGDPDRDGRTNAEELAAGTHPRGTVTRYFAEGATGPFFRTRFEIGNPWEARAALVQMRFLTDGGATITHDVVLTPHAHRTIDPATLPGLAHASFSTIIEADALVGVDRTMTWDASGYGSHIETGVVSPSTTWYFAEGSTSSQFTLFYLLQNPQATAVTATVRYLRPFGQAPIDRTYTLPPASRTTIAVDEQGEALASTDVSAVITADAPIVAERAMYFNQPGQPFAAGHESAGVTAPALEWFLAEGATGSFFDLFVLLANPNPVDATVEVEYLLAGGGTLTKTRTVPAQSRVTIWVDAEELPAGSGLRPLADAAVSTRVRSLNGVPIVVERTMWWPGPAVTASFWYEAHNSPGATSTGTRWIMGGGEANGPADAQTYVLMANPGAVAGRARVTLLFDDGATSSVEYDLPPKSRTNAAIGPEFFLGTRTRFSIVVESLGITPVPLVVERATYASPGGVTWAAGGAALASPWP